MSNYFHSSEYNHCHNATKILIQLLLQPPVNSKKRDIMMRFEWLLHSITQHGLWSLEATGLEDFN